MKSPYNLNFGLTTAQLPIIIVEIEGQKLCFILDTGANNNMIDSRVATYFKDQAVFEGENTTVGIEGNVISTKTVKMPFIFENEAYSPTFTVIPLLEAFKHVEKDTGFQIHGILGNQFFMEHKWIINFGKNSLYSE